MRQRYFSVSIALVAMSIAAGPSLRAQQPQSGTAGEHVQMRNGMMGMTDSMFVPMMIKHHQQGIEMARLEEERGSAASVKALAAKIRQSQAREIDELKAHATQTKEATSAHADHARMMEQQSQSMMAKLKSTSGTALDHAFLEQMSKHHAMAISMTEGAKLQDAELKKVAQKMVTGQRQELREIEKLLSSHAPK